MVVDVPTLIVVGIPVGRLVTHGTKKACVPQSEGLPEVVAGTGGFGVYWRDLSVKEGVQVLEVEIAVVEVDSREIDPVVVGKDDLLFAAAAAEIEKDAGDCLTEDAAGCYWILAGAWLGFVVAAQVCYESQVDYLGWARPEFQPWAVACCFHADSVTTMGQRGMVDHW